MQIESEFIASAIFGGFASDEIKDAFVELFGGVIGSAKALVNDLVSFLKNGFNFRQWFQDDPVGATAGALLGVVVLVVAGVAVGGIIGGIAVLIKGAIGGKIAQIFGALTFGVMVGNTIRFALRGIQFLWTFNINVTDGEIRAQQQGIYNSLVAQSGGMLGSWAGSLVCGAAPVELAKRMKSVKVRPDILARLKEISEGPLWGDNPPEIYEESVEQLKSLLLVGTLQLSRAAFLESYKNIRKLIRVGANSVNLQERIPWLGERIANWGQEEGNAWSFAQWFEEKVESINDEMLRGFTEEFFDEFLDQCSENLMIVSYAFG